MARLYAVIPYWEAVRLERRRRLAIRGALVVEEKLDGRLLVGYDGRVYTGSGRRAPRSLLRGLEEAGADLAEASRGGRIVYAELYGHCVPGETGAHRRDPLCYRAAFLDAALAPGYAGPLGEAVAAARLVQHPERLGLAEQAGLERPRGFTLEADGRPTVGGLRVLLGLFPGREGLVAKLYSSLGPRLPPDYGAKLRGGLAVKLRWEWFPSLWC